MVCQNDQDPFTDEPLLLLCYAGLKTIGRFPVELQALERIDWD